MAKNWLINLALGAASVVVIALLSLLALKFYTRHGETIEVPNIKGKSAETAITLLEASGLRAEIFDSVYNEDFRRDAVTEQDPPAMSHVKPDRIIYLTVNSLAKPKVKMPKLVDQSLALSTAVLKSAGLEIGDIQYRYDEIGRNLVIEQLYKGSPVPAGKMLEKGSVIDLIVATDKRSYTDTASLPVDNGDPSDPGI